jgi:hypothetical protein
MIDRFQLSFKALNHTFVVVFSPVLSSNCRLTEIFPMFQVGSCRIQEGWQMQCHVNRRTGDADTYRDLPQESHYPHIKFAFHDTFSSLTMAPRILTLLALALTVRAQLCVQFPFFDNAGRRLFGTTPLIHPAPASAACECILPLNHYPRLDRCLRLN